MFDANQTAMIKLMADTTAFQRDMAAAQNTMGGFGKTLDNVRGLMGAFGVALSVGALTDRKSTRLNSSHQ